MNKLQKYKLELAFKSAISKALDKHLNKWSIKTLDFANASTTTTDFYIKQESTLNKSA